jgi:hypothetical protein
MTLITIDSYFYALAIFENHHALIVYPTDFLKSILKIIKPNWPSILINFLSELLNNLTIDESS